MTITPSGGDGVSSDPSRRRLLLGAGASTAALVLTGASPASAQRAAPSQLYRPHARPRPSFIGREGGHFVLDGEPWRFGGANNYHLHFKSHYMIDAALNDIAKVGLKVVRCWAFVDGGVEERFHDGTPADDVVIQTAPYEYNEDGFDSLDYATYKAGMLGLRLVPVLVNNWADFGGMGWYVAQFGGGPKDDFYRREEIKDAYKAYARHVIRRRNRYTGVRYENDPTIMAWDIANEPRCASDRSGDTLVAWVDEMSRYVQQLAPQQLVTVGSEGFFGRTGQSDWLYGNGEGVDWSRLSQLPAIDYAAWHLHPRNWGRTVAWSSQWIIDHLEEGQDFGKPLVLDEYGIVVDQLAAYEEWLGIMEDRGGAGTMNWMFVGRQDDGHVFNGPASNPVSYPSPAATLLGEHAARMAAR